MTADIIHQTWPTKLDIDPDGVLESPVGELESVVVVGYGKDGAFYFASSIANGAEVVWLLEMAKKKLLEIGDDP